MTGRLPLLALVGIVVAGCWIEPSENAEQEARQDRRAGDLAARVRGALARSAAGWNRGDLEGFLDVYLESPSTTYVGGSGLRIGYRSIRERYAPLFRPGADRDSLRFEDVRVRTLGDGLALGIARWALHRNGRVTGSGPFTLVLRRVGDRWLIVHDHSSSGPFRPEETEGTSG